MTNHRILTNGLMVTVDVEDHSAPSGPPRFREALEPLLRALEAAQSRATFFIVGSLAADWPEMIVELDSAGHEVALHGYRHDPLDRLGRVPFAEDVSRGIGALGDVLGRAPTGYRAPYFSLTRSAPWAPEVLAEAGLAYSSSVLPAWNPQAGLPGAPKRPFVWGEGVIEFPVPVFGPGRIAVPVLGGAYLRLSPAWLVGLAARRCNSDSWTYAHPYDFDVDEPFHRLPDQKRWINRLLFVRRHLMLKRLMSIVGSSAPTLGERASDQEWVNSLPAYQMTAETSA